MPRSSSTFTANRRSPGKSFLEILQQVEARIWVAHPAALEYQKNRLGVISEQREAYKQIGHLLAETAKKLETQLRAYKRHPLINAETLVASINDGFCWEDRGTKECTAEAP
jgi:hypothetical protein